MQRHRPESLGRYELVAVGECGPGHAAPSEVSVNYDCSPLRLKMSRMEKSPPKGLMLSDLSCIFAMSVFAYMVDFASTDSGELSDITKPR